MLFASVLFVCGGAFGYYIAFPTAVGFLLDWIVQSHLTPIIDAGESLNLFFTIIVSLGIVFQIPAVIFVLCRIGLVSAGLLARKLKYAVFASVVVAAVITPTGEPGNMLIIAAPMVVLYVVGIGVAWLFGRPRRPGRLRESATIRCFAFTTARKLTMRAAVLLLCLSIVVLAPFHQCPVRRCPRGHRRRQREVWRGVAKKDAAAVTALYAANATLLPPNVPRVTGAEAILEFWKAGLAAAPPAAKLTSTEVEAHGDTAHEVGTSRCCASRRDSRRNRQVHRRLEARRRPMEAAPRHVERRHALGPHESNRLHRS